MVYFSKPILPLILAQGTPVPKLIQILTDIVCSTLLDPEALNRACRRAFTRNCGKLPYWTVMKLLLKDSKRTVSACLDEFFRELGPWCGSPASCSQQAFSKARFGISHSIFKECFERMLDFLCSADSLSFHTRFMGLWGCRLLPLTGQRSLSQAGGPCLKIWQFWER